MHWAVFVALIVIPTTIYGVMRRKRLKRFEEQLPDGLGMLSGAMRAGASLNIAMEGLVKEQSPPLSQEFELFMREQRIGVDFEDSLEHMEKRLPIQDFMMVCAACALTARSVATWRRSWKPWPKPCARNRPWKARSTA
ncbi:MAG: type II secretion system F family protein [Gammaproteobacteria bacterium]|nr:type II secretion system F family protein [Gammaproteobacteria bacterium]